MNTKRNMRCAIALLAAFALAGGVVTARAGQTFYVAPSGSDAFAGTKDAPFQTLAKAVGVAEAGDTILMRGGTYPSTATVVIDKAGTPDQPIRLEAFSGERPVLDYSAWKPGDEKARSNARGVFVTMNARWWVIKGLEICHAPDAGVKSEGGHITFDQCVFHHNGDTGLQIGLSKGKIKSNPDPDNIAAYNLVLNCDAYRNADVATKYENADGFACKLHAGKGNKFVGCRAWENADDGWDFFLTEYKIVLEHCWSWHQGDPSLWGMEKFQGDGNGFKLGGDKSFCNVEVLNCVALDCRWGTEAGFAYNNNTAPFTLYNCLTVNCGKPYKLRQAGNTLKNCVEVRSTKPAPRDIGESSTQANNSWNLDLVATDADFISLSATDAGAPRQADGSLPDNGFARLKPGSQLIDRGVDVGMPFDGAAPDLGPYEFKSPE
jgi:pectate disaccharide-lyase